MQCWLGCNNLSCLSGLPGTHLGDNWRRKRSKPCRSGCCINLVTNVDSCIHNVAVIILISHFFNMHTTWAYKAAIHNLNFWYCSTVSDDPTYSNTWKKQRSRQYQFKWWQTITYYGKTDLTFSISSKCWRGLGTPSLICSFISPNDTPGIEPKQ